MKRLAVAMKDGRKSDDPGVIDLAELHRLEIDRWFYPCSKAMHSALADMYESDDRFAANIDRYAAGLTGYFSEAIRANARR